jgi:hypothetical protein
MVLDDKTLVKLELLVGYSYVTHDMKDKNKRRDIVTEMQRGMIFVS